MRDELLEWFPADPILAVVFSLIINIVIAISGILPSAFITAGNIAFFGFETGLLVSIAGEAAGAIVSFILYRKGLIKLSPTLNKSKSKLLFKLKNTAGAEAIFLVLALRVLPFIPSGAVTLAAAFSKMGLLSFSVASTVGKIPSLLIEAFSVNHVLSLKIEWQISTIILFLLTCIFFLIRKMKK
ncbi:VTT domain-containing protein [Bacillus sp. DTU_2020_1000418_1_SI_GHA_SEK_038]|uniref:TVP38/TMEM64 family protein n=1 Tax=Bacillus sp. DTU_2020_1000418_1_SI_GHA_SEK_038 TaxID=3077585 RepID=UPI0028E360FF|nr:VTT domain-containing protein [Bacillus sp. DTU_2020_1000418_1_SI_GHA_SEK_038]WNS74931.1 VTT domain-containing protein [Bacillus sp. DTU_2020_1000418_1_SI_GHA_SEK_038]